MGTDADDDKDESAGLINLDMGQFGSGKMDDPLRHAMGMRSAQDACKMRMWTSFPTLFQNTIFHGEQDADIKALRHGTSVRNRLDRSKQLKEMGNAALKSATCADSASASTISAGPSEAEQQLSKQLRTIEEAIVQKEQELRELRKERTSVKEKLSRLEEERAGPAKSTRPSMPGETPQQRQLEDAITNYEKAAGLLRYVECVRPDWKNDDGSYKGIEDQHLRVDTLALEGDSEEAKEAIEMVTSCYLNIALASQKLEKFDQMKSACDEILDKVNETSVKALYRRAQARIAPASAIDSDFDAAIQDLHTAAQLAPQNQDVRGMLARLRTERKAQSSGDRNLYAGLFDRGQVVTNDPRTEGDKLDVSKLDIRDPKVQAMLDIRPGPNDY